MSTKDWDEARQDRERVEKNGLRPTWASRPEWDRTTGEIIGWYWALEVRQDSKGYLATLPDRLEAALPDQEVVRGPDADPALSIYFGKAIVEVWTRKHRKAA